MMICVTVMLAVFMGWPLAFGGKNGPTFEGSAAEARSVAAKPATASVPAAPAEVAATPGDPQAESCYKRYRRELQTCKGNTGAACRLKTADNWDLCEATGFWPQ